MAPARALPRPVSRAASRPVPRPLPKVPLPAGRPRAWYIRHNRSLKAMRLAIALLDSGVYTPAQATDATIADMAVRIGVHPPSPATCHLVRHLLPPSTRWSHTG